GGQDILSAPVCVRWRTGRFESGHAGLKQEVSQMNLSFDPNRLTAHIGQLFMIGIPGPEIDPGTEEMIKKWGVGGVILFKRNIKNPAQVASLCNSLQQMSIRYHDMPLFLAVDQEGGRVARLKRPFTEFDGQTAIGSSDDPAKEALEFARITAYEMGMVGLNMDMTPVLDVPRGTPEEHLKGRTFSEDPEQVAFLGKIIIQELQRNGVMAVGKHFPGLGGAEHDPHKNLPRICLSKKEMTTVDIPPFKTAITAKVAGIMGSHALYPSLDPKRPATLSYNIMTNLLRNELQFQGLVITDDLEMGAISKGCGVVKGAVDAFQAGADILLICEKQRHVISSMERLKTMLLTGEITIRRFRESLDRIVHAKARFLKNRHK
ncbi:MAG: beta-N-acetylhexosaminidase, partial [Deltaproteobacteria bacterium]|nr:beta-N-acetylhexosaminidase [Deltaproteobacteria bacterium]